MFDKQRECSLQHIVKYVCLGCGKPIGIQAVSFLPDIGPFTGVVENYDDKMILATLKTCPFCKRKLNEKSVKLVEVPRLGD